MVIQDDNYYSRSEVSNSDLSWLKNQLRPVYRPDPKDAYLFGSLLDAMLTEPEKVDWFNKTLGKDKYTKEQFDLARAMMKPFAQDTFCSTLCRGASGQAVMVAERQMNYNGYEFSMLARCKWDIWRADWGWGGDIKTTTATTQKEFEAAAAFFDYDRQRAWYMDIAGSDRDVLIGISKKNLKVFKIYISRDSEFYKNGKSKYMELAFRWHLMGL